MPRTAPIDPAAFLALVARSGAKVERAAGGVLTLCKTFTPGSAPGYVDAEAACSLVYEAPRTRSAGSVWGTDGASIGGAVGMRGGYCRLNVSGVHKRWLAAVACLLERQAYAAHCEEAKRLAQEGARKP